jgi:hypothetical protein
MVVAGGPASGRRLARRSGEDPLERQTPPGMCREAAEADVVEEDILGIDQGVPVRRGVRGHELPLTRRRHRLDGGDELLAELEHPSLRLERQAELTPRVDFAGGGSDLEHGANLPQDRALVVLGCY